MYASHVLPAARDYGALYRSFRWQIPARYNIGVDVCDRWAEIDPARVAIFNLGADGAVEEVSYGALREASNRLANALAARGIGRGDRIALLLPQGPAVAVSHIAIYKLGAIALPLAMLFGVEAIAYRLEDSGARAPRASLRRRPRARRSTTRIRARTRRRGRPQASPAPARW